MIKGRNVYGVAESTMVVWFQRQHVYMEKYQRNRGKGVNTLIILYAWTLWKHGNDGVFEGGFDQPEN